MPYPDDASLVLAPLVPYLAARALALGVGRRSPQGALALLTIAGLASAAGLEAAGLVGESLADAGLSLAFLTDVALGALCVAFGMGLASRSKGAAPTPSPGTRLSGAVLWLAAPLAGLALALLAALLSGQELAPATEAIAGLLPMALPLAAMLWLTRPASPAYLSAAVLTLVALSPPDTASSLFAPALSVAVVSPLLAALSAALADGKEAPGRLSEGLGEGLSLVASAGLGASLLATGLPWPVAGLAAGLCLGYARSRKASSGGTLSTQARTALAREAAMALAFLLGFKLFGPGGLALGGSLAGLATGLTDALPEAAAVAAAFALYSRLGPAGRGKASGYEAALAFAAVESAGPDDSSAMILGLAVAFLASVPRRLGSLVISRAEEPYSALKSVVGIPPKGPSLGLLSFAAALGDEARVIRAACVAAAEGAGGPTAADAEEALVRSIAGGAGAGIRILPSVVVSASVPDGLARAALERRADAVVVGLDAPGERAGASSKNVIDRLARAFPGTVIGICRPEAFAGSRRLVLIAVSGAESSPAIRAALRGSARAWGGPVSAMDAVMVGAPASALADASGGLLPESSVSSVATWRDVPRALERLARQGVSFVALSSRPGSKDWNPGHERLPIVLDSAFPASSAVLWILPGRERPDEQELDESSAAPPRLDSDSVPADPAGETPDAAARVAASAPPSQREAWPPLVAAAFSSGRVFRAMGEAARGVARSRLTEAALPGDRRAAGRLAAEFSAVARKEPIELAPGVLLLHAHAAGVALPTLAIGSRASGWPLVALERPVRIVVALVSPEDSGPEIHLEALTQIAKAFRNLGLAERLLAEEKHKET